MWRPIDSTLLHQSIYNNQSTSAAIFLQSTKFKSDQPSSLLSNRIVAPVLSTQALFSFDSCFNMDRQTVRTLLTHAIQPLLQHEIIIWMITCATKLQNKMLLTWVVNHASRKYRQLALRLLLTLCIETRFTDSQFHTNYKWLRSLLHYNYNYSRSNSSHRIEKRSVLALFYTLS